MNCRPGCGACCIAPSISSPIPGMPRGKPAGVRCVQLDDANRCRIFGDAARPGVRQFATVARYVWRIIRCRSNAGACDALSHCAGAGNHVGRRHGGDRLTAFVRCPFGKGVDSKWHEVDFCHFLGAEYPRSNGVFGQKPSLRQYNFAPADYAEVRRPCAALRSPSFLSNSSVRRARSNRNCGC